MKNTYIQMGVRIALVGAVLLFVLYALVVRGATIGNTFATGNGQGELALTIDSVAYYNGVYQPGLSWELKDLVPSINHFFDFDDVKPGDLGIHTISIHVDKNPAWMCLNFLNLADMENGTNEPESLDDSAVGGDLSSVINFFAWFDDGDDTFEVGEEPVFETGVATTVLNGTTYPLADVGLGEAMAAHSTHHVGIVWCAGELTVNQVTAEIACDGSFVGNESQTDSMTIDVSLTAVSALAQPDFLCIPPPDECDVQKGNNGHGNDEDRNDDSNPGSSNDPADNTDDDGLPPGFAKKVGGEQSATGNGNCKPKGNNGHGNDEDRNDDSNPGSSNDPADDTDDDGLPPGFAKKTEEQTAGTGAPDWKKVQPPAGTAFLNAVREFVKGKRT